jgi:hypothetical protein
VITRKRCLPRCPVPRRHATAHYLPPRPPGQDGEFGSAQAGAGAGTGDLDEMYEDLLDDLREIIREEVAEVAYIAMVSMSMSQAGVISNVIPGLKPKSDSTNPTGEQQ